MKKQIHLRINDDLFSIIKTKAEAQNITYQDFIEHALYHYNNLDTKVTRLNNNNELFTFIDLFAGIGGMRIAFESVGGICVFSSENNSFAQKTYFSNFNEEPAGDITKIVETDIPDHDILIAGFPCQPFSIAGVSKKNSLGKVHGFLDKIQGTLFFDVARIIKKKRPKAFLLENVKNLTTHNNGNTFKTIKETLESLDYKLFFKVVDGKHYVPQHRERIFIVGINNEIVSNKQFFSFPNKPTKPVIKFNEILEETVNEKYTLSDKLWLFLQNYAEKHKQKGNGFGFGLVNLDGISRTLSARYYKDGSEILIPQEGKNPRRLTPRECARLQGFPDSFKIVVSDTQAYKQFGNSVVVPLVKAIAKEIITFLGISEKHSQLIDINEMENSVIKRFRSLINL